MLPSRNTGSAASPAASGSHGDLRVFVFALFFVFGGITSLNDVLIPKLKLSFSLSYAEVMLVQSAFFLAYFIVSAPAGLLVQRIGYLRAAVVGLLTMAAGCLLFIPASLSSAFVSFLLALFVLAAGITIVQVVANPLISLLGDPKTAHSRLTFAQAFNSLGTTVFPYVGSLLILGSLAETDATALSAEALAALRREELYVVDRTYLGLALALLLIAAVVWRGRRRLVERPQAISLRRSLQLFRYPRFAFGTLGIFLYVGAEVAIGSVMVSYLMRADTLALGAQAAGERVALYWGGAMVGRFIGAALLRRYAPGRVLAIAASGATLLLAVSGFSVGAWSGWALVAIGLCNSIMFPTIFALACEGLNERAAEGSGLICMAIVGGAIVPLITGAAADFSSLKLALVVPAVCYVGIAAFGRYCRHHPAVSVS